MVTSGLEEGCEVVDSALGAAVGAPLLGCDVGGSELGVAVGASMLGCDVVGSELGVDVGAPLVGEYVGPSTDGTIVVGLSVIGICEGVALGT